MWASACSIQYNDMIGSIWSARNNEAKYLNTWTQGHALTDKAFTQVPYEPF